MIQYTDRTIEDCIILSDTDTSIQGLLDHIEKFRKMVATKNMSQNPVEIRYRVDSEYEYMYLTGVYQEYADRKIMKIINDIEHIDRQMTIITITLRKNDERRESIKTRQENIKSLKWSKEKMLDLVLNIGDDTSRKYIQNNIDQIVSDILFEENTIEKMNKVLADEHKSLAKLEAAKVARADLEQKLQERLKYLTNEN